MADFYKFIQTYEALIYILLGIAGMFSFRWLWRSWREWQTAVYQLEKDFSARRLGQSAAVSFLIAALFCIEFSTVSFILPNLPGTVFISTPTLDFISTPTGTLSPEMMTQFAGLASQNAPNATGCITDQVMLTYPEPGDEIKGAIEIIGTVDVPNFGFYKYEVAPAGSDTWSPILAGRTLVKNGPLGNWDTTALTPGDYQLRLVVTDNQGTALPACVVPVRVVPIQ
jgi:hypothetical protein